MLQISIDKKSQKLRIMNNSKLYHSILIIKDSPLILILNLLIILIDSVNMTAQKPVKTHLRNVFHDACVHCKQNFKICVCEITQHQKKLNRN